MPRLNNMEKSVEIVTNRVYFQVRPGNFTAGIHMDESDGFIYHFHCMDILYKTVKIRKYFGPPTLSTIHRFCALVDANLRYTTGRHLYHTNNAETAGYQQKRTNAIFLVGCYLMLRRDWSPDQTQERLGQLQVSLAPYTDMEGSTAHALSLLDCWRALHRGMVVHQWFQKRDTVRDIVLSDGSTDIINWIVPDKLLALEDPKEPRYMGRGPRVRPAIVSFFKIKRVEAVVRLNAKDYEFRTSYGQPYNCDEFVCRAIKHYDIFFKDGGIPADAQVQYFLKLVKKARHPIAVHCHAGRGRTGTMLAYSLIKFWGFEAAEAIAWVRMCRVACIVGIQQDFLKTVEIKVKEPETPFFCRSTQKPAAKVNLQKEKSTQEKQRGGNEHETTSAHLRVRRRTTIKQQSHRRSTRMNQTKIRAKKGNENSIEKVTVLPISGALNEVRRGRQRTGATETTSQSQLRIVLEPHLNAAATNNTCKSNANTSEAISQQERALNNREKTKSHCNVKLIRKIHPFYEQQTQKVKYTKGDKCEKIVSHMTKPIAGSCTPNLSSASVAEKTSAKGIEGLLRCKLRTRVSAPYELKETTRETHEEVPKQQTTCKGHVKTSKSSIPFTMQATGYSSNAPTIEQLTKLLSFEKDSKCPVPSYLTEHKAAVNSCTNFKEYRDGEICRPKKCTTVRKNFAKAEHRLAWQEVESNPHSFMAKAGRKESLAIHNDFVEKQEQALNAFQAAHCNVKDKIKIRNIRR